MSKYWERARIAFGIHPTNPERDPQPIAVATKAWRARWNEPVKSWESRYGQQTGYSTSWTKAYGGQVTIGSATKAARPSPLPAFSAKIATDYSLSTSAGMATVQLRSTGRELTAGGAPVMSVKAAGQDWLGGDLVELTTVDGRHYVIEHRELK